MQESITSSHQNFSDTCTGMMIENYLSTNATYPITYGTAITVACDPEYDLLGSKVITCESGIVYSHSSIRPKCVNKGMSLEELSILCLGFSGFHICVTQTFSSNPANILFSKIGFNCAVCLFFNHVYC